MTTVTVSVLGPLEVRLDGRPADVPRGHQRALLASLALNASQVVPQATLIRQLWGSEPPRNPRNAVQVHVRRLRGLLGDDRIQTRGGGYRLEVEPDDVDALRFNRLVAAAASAPPGRGDELLTEALGLWRGEALDGVGSPSLEREYGTTLTERRLLAVERRADGHRARGQPERDLAELRDLAERHPSREPLWARLIAGLLASGQVAQARDCHEQIRAHLVDTLGTDPGADLQRLSRRIDDGPSADDPRPDTGSPRQLPPDPVGFAGRTRELAALNELLAGNRATPAAQTVCVVHGPAGAGKTALAVHWAHQIADEFPDGQLYLDLHGYGSQPPIEPVSALTTILQAVGVPPEQLAADVATLTAALRTRLAGRRLLILLDNVRDADQVRPLLPGAQSLVVVTSRNQLGGLQVREGARQVRVGELGDDDARKLLAFSVAPARLAAEPAAVHRIVGLCGGLPLALRIVSDRAAWQPDVGLARIADDILSAPGRLAGLSGGDDPAADLRAVFSWSYNRLEESTATAFRRLGGYPGSEITAAGLAALTACSIRAARRELDRLVSVHLLAPRSPGRFRLHDLLREYAAELAAEDDPRVNAEAVGRLVDWCLHSVVRARETLGEQTLFAVPDDADPAALTFPTTEAVIEWFDAERELLVATVQSATEHDFHRQGHQLAHLLRTLFHRRLRFEEFVLVAELGVECARRLGDDEALARGLRTLGVAYTWASRTEDATEPLREAVEHAERLGDLARLVSAADGLAINCARTGDHATAIVYHRRAVEASRRLDDPRMVGETLMNLGFTEIDAGDYTAGIATTHEALTLFEATGAALPGAFAHGNLADAYQRTDRADLALDHAHRSLATLRTLGNLDATAEVLVTLGRAHQRRGESAEAEKAWREAADLIGTGHWLSETVAGLLAQRSRPMTDGDRG